MNIARMLKWVWKLYHYQNDQTIWTQLIRAKYHAGSDIFFLLRAGPRGLAVLKKIHTKSNNSSNRKENMRCEIDNAHFFFGLTGGLGQNF
jgi:hypothetical protein